MDSQQLNKMVSDAVQAKLDHAEPFTSVCISHPIIAANPDVRHRDVRAIISETWANGGFTGSDDGMLVNYLRTSITVYPDGSTPASAFLYHPSDYDPVEFSDTAKVLTRPTDSQDTSKAVAYTPNAGWGYATSNAPTSPIQKDEWECKIQDNRSCLNVPTKLICQLGWNPGKSVVVNRVNGKLMITPSTSGAKIQLVDQEGRIRLYGSNLAYLCGSPSASRGTRVRAKINTNLSNSMDVIELSR